MYEDIEKQGVEQETRERLHAERKVRYTNLMLILRVLSTDEDLASSVHGNNRVQSDTCRV